MSTSDRNDFAAAFRVAVYIAIAFGVLAVVWQISGTYAERRENAESQASEYADTTERRVSNACATVDRAAILECVTEQVEASRQDKRTEYDLQAQQDSADAAFWMALISFASLVATAIALWFVKRTLDATWQAVEDTGEATNEMKMSNEIARITAKRQLRAYVGVESLRVEHVAHGQEPRAVVSLKNFGQTPADKFRIISYVAFRPALLEEEFCQVTEDSDTLSTLAPGVVTHGYPSLGQKLNQLQWDSFASGDYNIFVYGEARYVDAFGDERTTGFRAKLTSKCVNGLVHHCNRGNEAT